MQNDISSALEAFEAAWQVVKTHPGERCETLALWIEECLYRAILLHLRARQAALYFFLALDAPFLTD